MSEQTILDIKKAIQAHIDDINEDSMKRVIQDWFVGYGTMQSCSDCPGGISYSIGYTTSDTSTPQGVVGAAKLALNSLESDLANGHWGPTSDDE